MRWRERLEEETRGMVLCELWGGQDKKNRHHLTRTHARARRHAGHYLPVMVVLRCRVQERPPGRRGGIEGLGVLYELRQRLHVSPRRRIVCRECLDIDGRRRSCHPPGSINQAALKLMDIALLSTNQTHQCLPPCSSPLRLPPCPKIYVGSMTVFPPRHSGWLGTLAGKCARKIHARGWRGRGGCG
jgi:hypothetical protein